MKIVSPAICVAFIGFRAFCFGQISEQNTDKDVGIINDRRILAIVRDNRKLNGLDRTPATETELRQLLAIDGVFSGEFETKVTFFALQLTCELIERSPSGRTVLPELKSVADKMEPPSTKAYQGADWDYVLMRSSGGRFGVLISCILSLSGERGFEEMFDRFESNRQYPKVAAILYQLPAQKGSEKYLDVLSRKFISEHNPQIKEAIQVAIRELRQISHGEEE